MDVSGDILNSNRFSQVFFDIFNGFVDTVQPFHVRSLLLLALYHSMQVLIFSAGML